MSAVVTIAGAAKFLYSTITSPILLAAYSNAAPPFATRAPTAARIARGIMSGAGRKRRRLDLQKRCRLNLQKRSSLLSHGDVLRGKA